jgi:N-acetyl-beta-hexosaminidase
MPLICKFKLDSMYTWLDANLVFRGIEVIPCIQTLGHMGQVLQWQQYAYLRDNTEVLLPESEHTYDFIEKMIQAACRPFRSKRIHIGMDEAHGVGEGRYRQLYGYKEGTQIFVEHLQKVNEICQRSDLQPMIWSDSKS